LLDYARVTDVTFQRFNALQGMGTEVSQAWSHIVEDANNGTAADEVMYQVRSNKTKTTRNKNASTAIEVSDIAHLHEVIYET
jgi:hypothetical protein